MLLVPTSFFSSPLIHFYKIISCHLIFFFFFNYKQNRLAFSSFSVYSHVAFSNLVVIFLALPCSLLIFLIPFLKFVCGSMYLIFHLTEATYESSNASRILLVGNTSEQL